MKDAGRGEGKGGFLGGLRNLLLIGGDYNILSQRVSGLIKSKKDTNLFYYYYFINE